MRFIGKTVTHRRRASKTLDRNDKKPEFLISNSDPRAFSGRRDLEEDWVYFKPHGKCASGADRSSLIGLSLPDTLLLDAQRLTG